MRWHSKPREKHDGGQDRGGGDRQSAEGFLTGRHWLTDPVPAHTSSLATLCAAAVTNWRLGVCERYGFFNSEEFARSA